MRTKKWHNNPVRAVETLLVKGEQKLQEDPKFTVGEFIKLLQMREEFGDVNVAGVEVRWVEPAPSDCEA